MLEPLNTENWNHVIKRCGLFLYETYQPVRSKREDSKGKCLGGVYTYGDHEFDIEPRFNKNSTLIGFQLKLDGAYVPADPALHPKGYTYHVTVKAANLAAFGKIYNL